MSKTKPNTHCPVYRCKAKAPHVDDPTVQGLFAEFSDPERTALWTMTAIGEVLNSMSADLTAGRNFALILRLRQVEELYVRALYAIFIADDGKLAHILSDEYPNSFSEMYREVNKIVLEGRGLLEVEYPGLNSGVFTAMDTINQGAHASFSAMMMVIGFARHPEHLEPYTSGRYFKHVDTYYRNLEQVHEMFKKDVDKATVLSVLINMSRPASVLFKKEQPETDAAEKKDEGDELGNS
jgi:hypothetical protein